MPLKGDFSKLQGLQRSLNQLAQVPSRVATESSKRVTKLLRAEYAAGADPYGKTWARKVDGSASHLTKSGAMKAGTLARPLAGKGIGVLLPSPGSFHQFGTSKMKARAVLPNKGLPATWNAELRAASAAEVKRALK